MDYSSLQMPPPNPGSQSPAAPRSPRSPNAPGSPPLLPPSVPQRRPSSSPHPQREQDASASLPQRRSSGNSSAMSNIESSVTKLLVSTKALLEGLTAWSQNKSTEQQVSDIYVQLIGEFNAVCKVFGSVNIDVSDLMPIPEKLRTCLEKALSEEASPKSLELYLPKIRDVIVTLLQGLKAKQTLHRQRSSGGLSRQLSTSSVSSTGSSRVWSPPTSPRPDDDPPSDGQDADGQQQQKWPTRANSGMTDSIAALKKSDALERRASKRFSAYTMQKSAREFSRRPAVRGVQETTVKSLSPSRLAAMREEDENAQSEGSAQTVGAPPRPVQGEAESTGHETVDEGEPLTKETGQDALELQVDEKPAPEVAGPSEFTLFLQVGKDVKKVRYDGDLSISALRILFIEKFSYNPGMDNFPEIYVKDKETGVMYELEDMSEVKNNSVLALNIETLEQIKKHFDQSIAVISQELKDVKKSFAENNELLQRSNMIISSANSPSLRPTPTEVHFREIARKVLASVKQKDGEKKGSTQLEESQQQSQQGGRDQAALERLTNDIKTQYDEVQNLRRDLGIMRQLYTTFQDGTQRTLRELGERTSAVKEFAIANVSSARAFIDVGKAKVDTRARDLLKRVDDLQDTIDELKLDITQRKCRPREAGMQFVKKESAAVAEELASLSQYIASVKPVWKKTWEEELQNIVEEQKLLNHQEELVEDLEEDYASVISVYKHILKVVEIQSKTRTKKEFRVAPPEEGFQGLKTVMQEVRGITPDSERRLRALENAERQRSRELSTRIDEFEAELTDFVAQSKLKKTGGAQEAERLRQKKDEETRKAMFKSLSADS